MKTMFLVLVVVFVCGVGATNETVRLSPSRMAWMKNLLDHHDWMEFLIDGGNHSVSLGCETDLRTYITALNDGQLWASKNREYSSPVVDEM
ncbi:unnamed protein product [Leptosia nina]|uniref:Uncharacterized protein n=1 Tax=Leptosia nina TaxID=320188 RepID=A0AAV1JJF2_9NEOP